MQSHRFSLTRSLLNTRWAFEQLMMITMIRKALIEWCFGVVLCCVVVLCSPWSEACWTPGEILTSWLSRWSEKHWSSDVYVTSGYHMVVTGDLQFWAADDDDDQKSIDEVMFTWYHVVVTGDDTTTHSQVAYLGLLENVRVRRAGFAYRQEYSRFLRRSQS